MYTGIKRIVHSMSHTMKGQLERERERERESSNNSVVISKGNNKIFYSRLLEWCKSACVGKRNQIYGLVKVNI